MNESENRSSAAAIPESNTDIAVSVFGRTDVGLIREHNEDNFLVADLSQGLRSIKPEVREHQLGVQGSLFAVCDGMGGAAAGEVASQIGVDTIYEKMQEGEPPENDEELARRLEAAISEAGVRIFTAAKLDRKRRGMGTTVTAAVMTGPRVVVGQVGDSRAYILRGEKLVQVTKDQSLVQQLLDAKQLTEEEAKNFDKSNIILQALGTTEEVHVDITSAVVRRGDTLVMCSDGLSGLVDSEAIRDTMIEQGEPMEACRLLTDLACRAGGHDNITVIVARFDGDGLSDPIEGEDLAYRKFRYASSAETTVRSSVVTTREETEPAPVQRETEPEPEPPAEDEEPDALPRSRRKVQSGLFAAATVALLVGITLIAYTVFMNDENEGAVVPINGNSAAIKSSPEAPVASENASEVPTPAVEPSAAPALTPTPIESISGEDTATATERDLARAEEPDPEEGSDDETADDSPDEQPRVDRPEPPRDRDHIAAARTESKKKTRRPSETVKEPSSEAKTKKKVQTKERKKTKVAAKQKKETESKKEPVAKPKPIDDNPF